MLNKINLTQTIFVWIILTFVSIGLPQSNNSSHYFKALKLMGKQQYDQALTILKKIQDEEFGYDAADKIVEIYKIKQDFESARNYFQQIQSEIKSQGIGYFGLARIAYEQKQYDQGIEILKSAIAAGWNHISIFNCLCRNYIWGNQLAEMQVYFENLLRQDSTNVNYWYGLALFYYGKFDYDTSLTLLNKLLKMVPDFRLALVWKQKIYLMTNKLRAGIEINLQLLHQAEQAQNLEQIAYHANELGRFYDNFSIHKALAYYQKSLELSTTIGMKVPQSITLGNIIGMYTLLGDARALDFLPRAIQLAREMNQPDEVGRHYLNIGVFYQNLDDREKALELFQNALSIFEKIEPQHLGYIASTLINISELLVNSGQYVAALGNLKKAADLARFRKDAVIEAKCWFRTGNIYFKTQIFDSARQHYQQALVIFQKRQDQLAEANCWNSFGQLYLKMQDYPQSAAAFQHALSIGKNLAIEKICWEAETGLAQVAEATQRYLIARQYYQQAITRIDRARDQLRIEDFQTSFMESTREIYQRWVELLLKMHDQQPQQGFEREAFYCAEKAKAQTLLNLMYQGQVFQNLDEISEELRLAWLTNGTELEQKNKALATELARPDSQQELSRKNKIEAEIARLQKQKTALHQKIARQYPQYEQLMRPRIFTIKAAQQMLAPNQALVEYFVGLENTMVWILQRDQIHVEMINVQREAWRKKLAGISPALFNPVRFKPDPPEAAAVFRDHAWARIRSDSLFALYRLLFQQPVEKYLPPNAEIIIVPDEALFYLPFEMLVTAIAARPRYLIERFPISYAASASCLNPELVRLGSPTKDLLALANPSFQLEKKTGVLAYLQDTYAAIFRDDQLLPLPHSENEAKAIRQMFPNSEVYLGEHASEARYKTSAAQFRYLHLATHNLLNDQRPMLSRLLLAPGAAGEDGCLNMYEIFNLKLNAEMVVLSACNSGLGKFSRGEGLIGLSRAFRYAGVPNIVASLWWVDDASTALLMPRFYAWLKAGFKKSVALQKAKIDLIQMTAPGAKPAMRNPFYWAPFVLMGNE